MKQCIAIGALLALAVNAAALTSPSKVYYKPFEDTKDRTYSGFYLSVGCVTDEDYGDIIPSESDRDCSW